MLHTVLKLEDEETFFNSFHESNIVLILKPDKNITIKENDTQAKDFIKIMQIQACNISKGNQSIMTK